MSVFLIVISIFIVILLNQIFASRMKNESYKNYITVINIIVCIVFCIIIFLFSNIKPVLNGCIDLEITKLENKVDEVYPGALSKQLDTSEVKRIINSSLGSEIKVDDNLEGLILHIVINEGRKYTELATDTINALEQTDNKLSVKDALLSIKELVLEAISKYLEIFRITIIVLFVAYILFSIVFSLHFSKEKNCSNKSITFGESADKTSLGMESKD